MTASVNVEEGNGAAGSVVWTVITQGRYCTDDLYNPGDDHPCVVPSAGYSRSYWKSHRLAFSGAFTKISNIRWYTSGNVKTNWTLGTGGKLNVARRDSGDNGCPDASYNRAVGSQNVSGTDIKDASAGHTYYKGQTIALGDADSFTSAAPLLIDSTEYTSANHSKHVVTQAYIGSDATQGDKPNETFTFLYDEI